MRAKYLLEVCRLLNLSHRLHQCILYYNADIGSRVALGCSCQLPEILRLQRRVGVTDRQLEHGRSRRQIRQADVNSPLKAATDGGVELPWNVCSTEDEDALAILSYTVHLHQHLCFYPP